MVLHTAYTDTGHLIENSIRRWLEFLMLENIAVVGDFAADKQVIFVDHFLTTQVAVLKHI